MYIPTEVTFHSYTYGDLTIYEVCDKLLEFYNKHKDATDHIEIAIGGDSQNKTDTKMVTVIVIYAEGKGGISFNFTEHISLVESVREKLNIETGRSLFTAETLIDILENDSKYDNIYLNCPISIHVDAGNSSKGKTKDLISSVVGWVKATGFDCVIKPDSYASSSVADKLSK